jgi:hypothetical protein
MPLKATEKVNWSKVINAIIQVESGGDVNAKSGKSVGPMQITPILVAECNRILEMRNSRKRYSLADRVSLNKSKEMFLLIQDAHNPDNNVEHAIRSWNGGQRYSKKATEKYYKKVMAAMEV